MLSLVPSRRSVVHSAPSYLLFACRCFDLLGLLTSTNESIYIIIHLLSITGHDVTKVSALMLSGTVLNSLSFRGQKQNVFV